ncbi:hypothetical protein HD712_18135 [Clostridium gasigenes]|nr:hypothetical protein [Clostridium gasigenes]NKF08716.1 hypothetical protein [Clostridium gasigenes]
MNSALIQVIGVTGIELATVNSTIGNVDGTIKCINDFTVVLEDNQGISLYPICSLAGFRVGIATPVVIPTGCNIPNTCSRCANTVKNSLCNLKTFIPTEPINIDVEGNGFNLGNVIIDVVGQSVVSVTSGADKFILGMCYIDQISGIPSTYTGACFTGANV